MFSQTFSSSACRVCLTMKHGNTVFMTKENGYLEWFYYCFGLQIQVEDPARILCEECADNLNKFAVFKEKCLKSDKVWKSNICTKPDVTISLSIEEIETKLESEEHSTDCYTEENLNEFQETLEETEENKIIFQDKIFYSCTENLSDIQNDIDSVECSVNNGNDAIEKDTINSLEHYLKINNPKDSPDCKRNKNLKGAKKTQTREKVKHRKSNKFSQDDQVSFLQNKSTCLNDSISDGIKNVLPDVISMNDLTCKCGTELGDCKSFEVHTKYCNVHKLYHRETYAWQNCGLCKFSTKDIEALWKHLNEHFSRNDLECKLCDYTAREFSEMAYHRFKHLGDEIQLYCFKCRQLFKVCHSLHFHFRTAHANKTGGLCRFCDVEFKTMRSGRRHEEVCQAVKMFGSKPEYICDCCGFKFSSRYTLIEHIRSLAGKYRCVCDKCGAVFARPWNLKEHINHVHTKSVRTNCPKCKKTMKTCHLQKHINTMHGKRSYTCDTCSKTFQTKPNLRYHMLSHTNSRPFVCDICGATYKTSSQMKMHKRCAHTSDRPYVCTVCTKGFSRKRQLYIHTMSHTKIRPFKCGDCHNTFNTNYAMKKHRYKAHPGI